MWRTPKDVSVFEVIMGYILGGLVGLLIMFLWWVLSSICHWGFKKLTKTSVSSFTQYVSKSEAEEIKIIQAVDHSSQQKSINPRFGKSNKVVYCHRRKTNNVPFYIGLGSIERAYNFKSRNYKWKNVFHEHGCAVEILHHGLTPEEAAAIEIRLIREYRKEFPGQMTNISNGGETGTNSYRRRAYR